MVATCDLARFHPPKKRCYSTGSELAAIRPTADCSDIGLTAQFYRPPRLTVEIASRRGCPSASTCIQCATRFNLVATCCVDVFEFVLAARLDHACLPP